MNPQCQHCGKIVALKAGITTEFSVRKEFQEDHPDTPEKMYLCAPCSQPERVDRYRKTTWYAGHRII